MLVQLAFAALLVGAAAPALAQVVARVNGAPITQAQLDRVFNDVLRERNLNIARMQDPAKVRDLRRLALDRLIQEELFWQQAQRERLVVSDADVEAAFRESMARFPSRQAFELQLIRQGTDEKGFREQIRRLLSADRYAQRVVDERVAVSDADVAMFYRENAATFDKPEMLKVRTIVIRAAGPAEADRRNARRRAEALREQLVAGADFDALARQTSDDPTRPWGGALDPATLEQLPAWMRAPVAQLAPGALSPVVEAPEGFAVLKLDARVPAVKVPLDQARPQIRSQLQAASGRAAIDEATRQLRAAASVEMLMPL